jgi:hypothetical protein
MHPRILEQRQRIQTKEIDFGVYIGKGRERQRVDCRDFRLKRGFDGKEK